MVPGVEKQEALKKDPIRLGSPAEIKQHIPGSKLPSVVQAILFGADPYGYLKTQFDNYGPYFRLKLPGEPPIVVVCEPEGIDDIMLAKLGALDAEQGIRLHVNMGEESLIFLDGERHTNERKIVIPVFNGKGLQDCGEYIQLCATQFIDDLPVGRTIELIPRMHDATLDIILNLLFGSNQGEQHEALKHAFRGWIDNALSVPMFMLATVFNGVRLRKELDFKTKKSFEKHADNYGWRNKKDSWWMVNRVADYKAEVVKILLDEVEAFRETGDKSRTDALSLLCQSTYDDGKPVRSTAVVDQLVTLMVGGHHTTSTSMGWAVLDSIQHPKVLEKIKSERKALFEDFRPNHDEYSQLIYLNGMIKESMRTKPVAPAVTRYVNEALKVGRYELPEGTMVWPCVYMTHMNPDLWDKPEQFEPERFVNKKIPSSAFLTFGSGRRRCIGSSLAYTTMNIFLSEFFDRVSVKLADNADPKSVYKGINITPNDDLRVVIEEVRPSKQNKKIIKESSKQFEPIETV